MTQTVSVVILSDTHAQLHPEIETLVRECDIVIHAGDICDGGILDALQPRSGRVIAVAGNNDHEHSWPEHQSEQVKSLPHIASLELPGGLIKIEHGHRHDMIKPDHEDLREAHPEARMVVYGHTHRKVIDDFKLPWVVNPGAAGDTRTRGGASCLVLTASDNLWKLDSYRFLDIQSTSSQTASAA
jgi:putative phosphoesterase